MKRQALIGGLAFAIIFGINSCGNENESPGPANSQEMQKQKILKELPGVLKRIPQFRIAYEKDKSTGKNDKDGGFSFSNSGDGFSFANPSGNTYTSEEGYVVVTTPGLGSNTGGVVAAGSNTYNIEYTFCLAAEEEDEGEAGDIADAFDFGVDGVSLVLGVSGDLEAASNEDMDAIDVLVLYVVFDDRASGRYEVFNFFEEAGSGQEDPDFEDLAFAYIVDFENGFIYFSSDGSLNVDGGSITFDGEYLEIPVDIDEEGLIDFDEIEDFNFVSGAGSLGC